MFDPYEKWLGIPKDQQPPSHYRLLGISPQEKDPDVIEEAARRVAGKLAKHRDGPQTDACIRLLKEIKQAKATLLDPAKRKEYDARLRQKASEQEVAEEDGDNGEEVPEGGKLKKKKKGNGAKAAKKREEPEEKKSPWLWVAIGGAAVLLLAGGGVAFWLMHGTKEEPVTKVEPVALAAPTKAETPPTAPTQKEAPIAVPTAPAPSPSPPPAPVVAKPPEPKPVVKIVKMPVPSEADQARAEQALKATYKEDYAKTKPEDKLAQAAKFLQPGRENRSDPAAWFVLPREARDLSIQAERPRLAMEAINEIDKWFIIDAAEMKTKTLTALSKSTSESVTKSLALIALGQMNQAIADDNYDAALRMIAAAETAAGNNKADKDKKQADMVQARKTDLQALQKDFQPVAEARKKLQQAPTDPEANLVAGKYLCFFHARWDEGLPLLAKGSDAALKALAQKDLANPTETEPAVAVADGWWDRVEGQPGRTQRNIQQRARLWYERAQPKATGFFKTKVEGRLKQIEEVASLRIPRLMLGSYYGRTVEDKVLLLREGGGTMKSEEAIQRGLEWLVNHQDPRTGMWSINGFPETVGCNCGDPGDKTKYNFPIAGTAFGLLPFLGAGETHRSGPHAQTVQKGLEALLRLQQPGGNFSDHSYENALATIAVCEAYGLSKDPRLRVPAQAAVNYVMKAQHGGGSWGYGAGAAGDTSASGWQFAALKAGVYANLKVPLEPFTRMAGFLDTVADPNGLGYGYNTPGAGKSTSAVGLLCRLYLGMTPTHPVVARGIDQLLQPQNLPARGNMSIYYVFYATQLMHHAGGKSWDTWNDTVRDLLIDLQDQGLDVQHAHQKGSWSPKGDDYAPQGGRLMFTSLALITLEMYYYSVPVNGYGPAVLPDEEPLTK